MSDNLRLPDSLVDAFAQCLWIRMRPYVIVTLIPEPLSCDFADLPEMSRAPFRLAAREMLELVIEAEDENARELPNTGGGK